ncbi:MAG TPA: helix-turn-helix domain-containing protein, partial [Roseiflexaceae bacterium]
MKNRGRAHSLQLSWHEIGFICEGMSLASRPIRIATKRISDEYSLGPRGAWMLLLIATGEVFPMDLTKIFQVGRSLITAELNRLSDANLITYRQSALDGRRTELAVTPL